MGFLQNVSLSLILSSRFDQSVNSHEKSQALAYAQLIPNCAETAYFYTLHRLGKRKLKRTSWQSLGKILSLLIRQVTAKQGEAFEILEIRQGRRIG